MPVFTDEDVGLGSSYLTDEDVGLGGNEQGGDETWSPEEQTRLEVEEAGLAPATGFKAGLSRFRASSTGRALFGPTDVEREAGAMSTGSPGEIAGAALKFMTVPPQLANPIRAVTEPAIEMLPPALSGVATGVREVALSIPGPSFAAAPRLAMAAFGAQTVADLPGAKRAYEDALERGDTKAAAMIATQTVGNTALLGLGAATMGPRRFAPPERGGIPEPVRTTGEPDAIQEPGRKTQPASETAETAQIRAGEPQGEVQDRGEELPTVQPKEGNAPQEPGVLLTPEAQAKWTKATELLKTPDGAAQAEARPVDWSGFYATDAQGNRSFNVPKLRTALESGELASSPESSALLLHMLKESDLHPIESITPLEFTPDVAGMLSGEDGGFSGRFRIKRGERTGLMDLTMKADNGEAVSQADFVHAVTHELFHNNVTSKVAQSPEAQAEIGRLFKLATDKAKDTATAKEYGLTNESDFIAELANPKFVEFLNGVKDGNRTLLQRVTEIIQKLFRLPDNLTDVFGRKVDSGFALASLLKVSSKLEKIRRTEAPVKTTEFMGREEKLPPVPKGHVRLFHGEGGPQGGGKGGSFYTESMQKAATFGPDVSWVDVPAERAQAAREAARKSGQGGDTALLTKEDVAGAKRIAGETEAKVHDLDEPTGDFKSAIKDTEKVTNEELLARKGGATGFMWELGAKAKTAEDVAALKTMAEESSAKAKELMKAGDIPGAMAILGRQRQEAYEYATGVQLDGKTKWPFFEKRSPGYVPPVPDAKYVEAKGGAAKVEPVAAPGRATPSLDANAPDPAKAMPERDGDKTEPTAPNPTLLKGLQGRSDEARGKEMLRQLDDEGSTPQRVVSEFWKNTYPTLPNDVKVKFQQYVTSLTGFKPGDAIGSYADGRQITANSWADVWTDISENFKYLQGEERGLIALMATANKNRSSAPGKDAPQVQKWITATEEAPAKPETGMGGQMLAGIPNPAAVYRGIQQAVKDYGPAVKAAGKVVSDATKDIYKENLNIRKMNDLDRSVLNWSGKEQRSFGESTSAGKDIEGALTQSAEKQMGGSVFTRLAEDMATGGRKPNQKQMVEVADGALSNWLEAGGGRKSANDIENALVFRRNAATDPKLKAGYEAALHLSPEEQALALDGRTVYDQLWDRAERWGLVDKDPTKPSAFRDDYVTHLWNLGKGTFAGGARTLKDQFKFAKARTFENYFEGEQAGFKPKTKRLSQLLPVYIHEMNSVIAAKQLVKQMWGGKASDGSPLLATRGIAQAVNGAKGEAVLVRPEAPSPDSAKKGLDISKYKELPGHSALHDWVFAGKDTAGNPIFEKSDLVLHPEAYKKLKAILGKSKIRNWYETKTTATMEIPKFFVKALDVAQQETKRTMLGMLSPFHQVQEGTHAVGHRVNPFWGVPKPNMENPVHLNLAKKGLMILPDRASERNFTEGLRPSGLVSKIPGIGPLADHYSNYLFHEYIPGLKIKTALAIIERNKKVYEKQLASGEVSLEDVELLSTTQSNAAFGHMNYADLGRDPTIQHILQLGLLAPDFLEARTRFTGQGLKGVTGAKVGREQLLALATLALGQAALAYTMSKITDGEWDGKHPFEFRKNNRRYTLRSVPEDIARLLTDSRQFISNRLNPITAKLPTELYFKRDQFGRKITSGEALKRGAFAPAPLTVRGFMGIDKSPLEDWEELAGAVGLKVMNYSPQNEVHKLFMDWKKKSEDPRLVAQAEQSELMTFPTSIYADLRQAMERNNFQLGAKAYEKLLETHSAKDVKRAMNPLSVDESTGAVRDKMLPKALEAKFLETLKDDEREVYEAAKRQRRVLYQRFQKMLQE